MEKIESFISAASNFVWGVPLLVLVMGGGIFFMLYSGFAPFAYFRHALDVLRGKHDDPDAPGDVSHFQALSGALAATIGMGNVSGVAIAIVMGGPGVIFWMWVSAFFGMATKFFTCTLAVMYRGKDSNGEVQGGPMYFITEGLGPKWKPMAIFFSVFCFFGATPIFQANQVIQVTNDVLLAPAGFAWAGSFGSNLVMGLVITALTCLVIFGGIRRIGLVASRMVPFMVVLYMLCVLYIMGIHFADIPHIFGMILSDAFTAKAAMGGAIGALIIEGAKRASFSNEAGIGTAPLMHGASKTKEPVREGLVAMMGPAIDTLIVCTLTGFAILATNVWQTTDTNGITLTGKAFEAAMPTVGPFLLFLCVLIFGFTTLFSYSYYGTKCVSFLAGAKYAHYFNYWYVSIIIVGSITTLTMVVDFINVMFGLMAIPTMTAAILLAPKVKSAANDYFGRVKRGEMPREH